jgi:hypothetical protein
MKRPLPLELVDMAITERLPHEWRVLCDLCDKPATRIVRHGWIDDGAIEVQATEFRCDDHHGNWRQ